MAAGLPHPPRRGNAAAAGAGRGGGAGALFFGLIRPYKGVDLLLEAFREIEGAELWIVGRPFGVDMDELEEAAAAAPRPCASSPVRHRRRDPGAFRRADLVVLPHRDAEQSGVLYTALPFGKAILMSDVGGFPEVAAHGAGRTFAAKDAAALAGALEELLTDAAAREASGRRR